MPRATKKTRAANGANSHLNSSSNNTPASPPKPFVLKHIVPITQTQSEFFKAYEDGKQIFMNGYAGTGKTYIALARALRDVESENSKFKKVAIVRSAVEVRSIGALPGTEEDKLGPFELPYVAICEELYGCRNAYDRLKREGTIEFIPTSFIRGRTLNDMIVIVDESSNLSMHELDSVITRLGKNSRIIFCGDHRQSDLTKDSERQGYVKFEKIIERMQSFVFLEFTASDIVRGPLVKEYLIASNQ
jgi:phosphate starvation-inducible protein PhoH